MYTAIIADDEVHVCLLLQKLVNWDELGIRIAGIYSNGLETFRAIKELRPDIVISDIRMPGMNGLDLVKNCIDNKIDTMFILISGHAEFEYAHMAIAYGVENYLLKPINAKELEENLKAITGKLDKIRIQNNNLAEMQKKIHAEEETLGRQFLKNFLSDPISMGNRSIQELNTEYCLNLADGFYQMIAVKPACKVYFTSQQITLLLKQIESYAIRELKKYYEKVMGYSTDLEGYFLLNGRKAQEGLDYGRLFFNDLGTAFYEYCDITVGSTNPVVFLKEIDPNQTREALLLRYNHGINHYYRYEEVKKGLRQMNIRKSVGTLAGCIDTMNTEGVERYFRHLKDAAEGVELLPASIISSVELIRDTFIKSYENLIKKPSDRKEVADDFEYLIRKSDSKEELFQGIAALICQKMENVREKTSADSTRVIRIAREYVEEHLSEKIVLEDIAGIVYMNPTYFSTLFKKETGENFSDYLTRTRVEKAKKLLASMELTIQQVGEQVGYDNARYFSKVFMKIVGISPSDYRKYSKFL